MKKKSGLIILLLFLSAKFIYSQNSVLPEEIRVDATYESIGINWTISNDDNFNSTLIIEFKKATEINYKKASKTIRANPNSSTTDGSLDLNFHAGSALFLEPGTTYDIKLKLEDLDGGSKEEAFKTNTKNELPKIFLGTNKHVIPGSGGGSGSAVDPYKGLQEAANNAGPGDIFLLSSGTYANFKLNKSGNENEWIVFKGAPNHSSIINGNNTDRGVITLENNKYIVLDGLTIENGEWGIGNRCSKYPTHCTKKQHC